MRTCAVLLFTLCILMRGPALAQVVINVPDIPVFTLDQPIAVAQPVIINAGATTDVVIDAGITALSVDIVAGGDVSLAGGGSITSQTLTITSGGLIDIPDTDAIRVSDEVNLTANGATITLQQPSIPAPGAPFSFRRDGHLIVPSGRGAAVVTSVGREDVGIASVGIEDAEALEALDGLAFEETAVTGLGAMDLAAEFGRSARFVDHLFSCPSRDGEPAAAREEPCVWGAGSVTLYNFNDDSVAAFDELTYATATGGQVLFSDTILVGGAVGYEATTIYDGLTGSFADRGRAGLLVKYVDEGLQAGLAVAGAIGLTETRRGTPTGIAIGKARTLSATLRAEIGYTAQFGPVFLRPSLGGAVTYLNMAGFTEEEAGINNRVVAGADATSVSLHPRLEFGGTFTTPETGTTIRPRISIGADWYEDPVFTSSAELAGLIPLRETVALDDVLGTVELGFSVYSYENVMVDISYRGLAGQNTRSHSGAMRVHLTF
ncbi:MAG: autotransporter outer membrane beta-barrel domain-containing protein [Pseudomonadota bacterium]